MRNTANLILIAAMVLLLSGFSLVRPDNLIAEKSVGKIKLGMTVAQAREVLPKMTFSRTSDGEGMALIAVNQNKMRLITLYAGEDSPETKINEEAKIKMIEVWDKHFKTKNDVHVGMLLRDVEKHYGKLKNIVRSEIESREYATFDHQPKAFTLRVAQDNGDYAGSYGKGKNSAASFFVGSYVKSISIGK